MTSSGVISGKINYSAATDTNYNVTITVSDPHGAQGTRSFTWTVKNAALGTLEGTERHSGSPLPNSITVNDAGTNYIYICPGNNIQLAVAAATSAVLPKLSDVLFEAPNALGPFIGTFSTTPILSLPTTGNITIMVGLDVNLDGVLTTFGEGNEVTLKITVRMIDFAQTKLEGARTSTTIYSDPDSLDESYYQIQANEIFDTSSTFGFRLSDGVQGMPSMIRPQLLYGSTVQTGVPNSGTSFEWPLTGTTSSARVRFYADADNSGTYNPGELMIETALFTVTPLKVRNFTYDISDVLAMDPLKPFLGQTTPDRTGLVQDKTDRGNKIALIKNSATDFRAAVQVILSPLGTGIFVSTTSLPDHVATPTDETNHYWNMPANHIRFVSWLGSGTGLTQSYPGFGSNILIEWPSQESTIIHEVGHTLGIANNPQHDDLETKYIMTQNPVTATSVELTLAHAKLYSGL